MDRVLANRVVAVSGAAGGIGAEVVRVLAEEGAAVSATDVHPEILEKAASDLREHGTTIVWHPADLTDRRQVRDWIARTEQDLGPIEALVNVAGVWRSQPVEEISETDWATILSANLTTTFFCCQAVIPGMKERRRGSIVNFASTAGEYGSISPAAHYAAAKGGVIALTKSLAREVGSYGVRVNALSPGPTDTPALGADTVEKKRAVATRTLLGRLGTPADIAQGVLYLVGPGSAFITGTVLQINGGSLL